MHTISNDRALRQALDRLSLEEQRMLGGRFVNRVAHLCEDARVRFAVSLAMDPASSPAERDEAFRGARAYAVKTYTECGKDTNWLAQAAHFVAIAAAVCLTPEGQAPNDGNLAWKAAMQARMARNCELIEHQDGVEHEEPAHQYQLANQFFDGLSGTSA